LSVRIGIKLPVIGKQLRIARITGIISAACIITAIRLRRGKTRRPDKRLIPRGMSGSVSAVLTANSQTKNKRQRAEYNVFIHFGFLNI
jgi:hypothetical protein